jgi:hypothetical protein
VIYGTLRRWSPDHFRAILQCYFLFTYVATMVSHGVARLLTPWSSSCSSGRCLALVSGCIREAKCIG